MGDWTQLCLGESKSGQTYGIRNIIQRATLILKFKYWSAAIIEIILFQYRVPQKQEKGVYIFFFPNCMSLLWRINLNWFQGHIVEYIEVLGSKRCPVKIIQHPLSLQKALLWLMKMKNCNMIYQNYKSKCNKFHSLKEQQKMKWKFWRKARKWRWKVWRKAWKLRWMAWHGI